MINGFTAKWFTELKKLCDVNIIIQNPGNTEFHCP